MTERSQVFHNVRLRIARWCNDPPDSEQSGFAKSFNRPLLQKKEMVHCFLKFLGKSDIGPVQAESGQGKTKLAVVVSQALCPEVSVTDPKSLIPHPAHHELFAHCVTRPKK